MRIVVVHLLPLFLLILLSPCAGSLLFGQMPGEQIRQQSHNYFIDCSSPRNGSGDTAASPWNSLDLLQAKSFNPGDVIRLRRGTECHGSLQPRGSGSEDRPLRLTAYGEGTRPKVIAPATSEEALRLFDQEYWDIDSLDLSGGNKYGVFVSGTKGILHHIHLSNLSVHDVRGDAMKNKDNGLIVLSSGSVDQHFDDVLVDGVTAWDTNQWAGIMIGGGNLGFPPESNWSTNVLIRNSTVHDVQGDGIVLFRVRNGRIESSIAWNTGMQITQSIGTPNAIWTWMCDDCTVQNDEAYLTDSPGVDGGAFDIDYGNTKNAVIGNYGHDTQGYCVSVFGAGFVTRQSTIRGNLCINNARSPRLANYQGAIFLLSWNGGSIDGLSIEDNTVFWNPYENAPAFLNNATIKPGTAVFRNNRIYSTAALLVDSKANASLKQNQYSYFGADNPQWRSGSLESRDLPGVKADLHQEMGSTLVKRPLASWHNVYELSAKSIGPANSRRSPVGKHDWVLRCDLPVSLNGQDLLSDAALQQITVLKSLSQQYQSRGLKVELTLTTPSGELFRLGAFRNAITDLDLKDVAVSERVSVGTERTLLIGPDGRTVTKWDGFQGPNVFGFAARRWVGEPSFSQMHVQ